MHDQKTNDLVFFKFLNAFCFNNFQNNINGRKNFLQKSLLFVLEITTYFGYNRLVSK